MPTVLADAVHDHGRQVLNEGVNPLSTSRVHCGFRCLKSNLGMLAITERLGYRSAATAKENSALSRDIK
jgi:hypothetical protein